MAPTKKPGAGLLRELFLIGFVSLVDTSGNLILTDPEDRSREIPKRFKAKIKKLHEEVHELADRERRRALAHLRLVWQIKDLFPPCRAVVIVDGLDLWCRAAIPYLTDEQAQMAAHYLSKIDLNEINETKGPAKVVELPKGWS